MSFEDSPSSVLFAQLKAFGISNREAAMTLLKPEQRFGDSLLLERINSRSQLSRSIVHVVPDVVPATLFRDFSASSADLTSRIMAKLHKAYGLDAARIMADELVGQAAGRMSEALETYGRDGVVYRNAVAFIENMASVSGTDRALLHLMLFVTTGCTANPAKGAKTVSAYAANYIGDSFRTTEAGRDEAEITEEGNDDPVYSLARVVNGKLKGSAGYYALSLEPEGTIIGALAEGSSAITDVGEYVSRKHARVYREGSHWYVIGLGSMNGTVVERSATDEVITVEPPRKQRDKGYVPQPVELHASDVICLGGTTRFVVVPIS